MHSDTPSRTVVLASGNRGKLQEFSAIFAPLGFQLLPQSQFAVPTVEETGLSFVENALLKARAAAEYSQRPAIADDSGLAVDFLQGAPGIYSARYAGGGDAVNNDRANNDKLLAALDGVAPPLRSARYHCVLVYLRHAADPVPVICHAAWEGSILTAPRGTGGFGYDPLFFVPDHGCSAAELSAEVKNRISHRAQASALLFEALRAL